MTIRPGHRPHRLHAAAWWLALALLQAQLLGLWHRVAHPPAEPGTAWVQEAAAAAAAVRGEDAARAGPTDAFGHAADDDAQCRLYDALGLCSGIADAGTSTAEPPAAQAAPRGLAAASPAQAAARAYLARAPPA